jgi:hypothetical protein
MQVRIQALPAHIKDWEFLRQVALVHGVALSEHEEDWTTDMVAFEVEGDEESIAEFTRFARKVFKSAKTFQVIVKHPAQSKAPLSLEF